MKRRQFLKSIFGAVTGLIALPSVVKAKEIDIPLLLPDEDAVWPLLPPAEKWLRTPEEVAKLRYEKFTVAQGHAETMNEYMNNAIDWEKFNKAHARVMITGQVVINPLEFIKPEYRCLTTK